MTILFHGSTKKFKMPIISTHQTAKNGTQWGLGLYLTPNPNIAKLYTDATHPYIYKTDIHLNNEISTTKITFSKQTVLEILKQLQLKFNIDFVECFQEPSTNPLVYQQQQYNVVNDLINNNTSDLTLINDIINSEDCAFQIFEILKTLNYSHAHSASDSDTYILYDLSLIKTWTLLNLQERTLL